jgi:hypothetical protein
VNLSERCEDGYDDSRAGAAILRRQSGHRQSPPSVGIGRRNDSSRHQHAPDRLQVNSVPHFSQAIRRGGLSDGSVIDWAAILSWN